jgi:integrase
MSVHKINRGNKTTYRVKYRDEHGKQQSKSFKTRREADDFDAQTRADKTRGVSVTRQKDRVTFRELAYQWRSTKGTLRRTTLRRIDTILERHLLPALGHKKLAHITRDLLQQLVNQWTNQGLKPRTILNHRNVLVPILELAVADDIIHKNPASHLVYPAPGRVKRHPLTPDECKQLLDACDPFARVVVWFGLATGLRFAEIASLDVSDFNPQTGTVSVRHSKTDRGIRDVAISREQSQDLEDYLASRKVLHPDDPLLATPRGNRIDPSNFQRHFKPAVKKSGLRGVTFHDLRRTHATALIAAGLDPKVIQERLGHSSIQTTLALYARATQEGLTSASAVMGRYLSSTSKPVKSS